MTGQTITQCDDLCVCVEFEVNKKNELKRFKENLPNYLLERLKSLKSCSDEYAKEMSKDIMNSGLIGDEDGNIFLGILPKESPKFKAVVEIRDLKKAKKTKSFKEIKKFFSLVEQHKIKINRGMACGSVDFNPQKFTLTGGISLPKPFGLPEELEKKIGRLTLSGFKMNIDDSPIGIEQTTLNSGPDGKKIDVTIKSSFNLKSLENLMENSNKQVSKLAKMFVEKKT